MMSAKDMANAIKNSDMKNCKTAESALQVFWNAVCDYVTKNLEAKYSWEAVNPETGMVDPITVLNCKATAFGTITPSYMENAKAAIADLNAKANTSASAWTVTPDTTKSQGFAVSVGYILPMIVITVSELSDFDSSLQRMCTEIIQGIKVSTPVLTGSHAAFIGTATFVSIV